MRRWAAACVQTLDEHRDAIDRINVFPVADRDTGTNMLGTMRAALDAAARITADADTAADNDADDDADPRPIWSALAGGALAGARGNSGVILSQVIRGLAEVLGPDPTASRAALNRADELAAKAVSDPAPGTMLTVLHAAARAGAAEHDDSAVIATAAKAAWDALSDTSTQLDALARAGVVDAGAQGLVLVLDELAFEASGGQRSISGQRSIGTKQVVTQRTPRDAHALHTAREAGSAEYAYEVMFALDAVAEPDADRLRAELRRLGDCVSVVGDGGGSWAVHVHCNDVGAAIEAGIDVGRPHRIAVVRFDDQVAAAASRFAVDRAVVALARGAGTAELFRDAGASALLVPEGELPTVSDLVAVIAGTQASHVTILPNLTGLEASLADAAAEAVRAGQDVIVVPTASPVQGLAALAVHEPSRRPGEDVVAMAEAAAATRRGELVLAGEQGITWVGVCQPGDVLGLLDGEIVLIEPGPAGPKAVFEAAHRLVDRMLSGGGELVTALFGADSPDGLADDLAEHVRTEHREVEFTGYPGGQRGTILLLGVE
ncbi:MAG TPA: DAK2 domain-containing protein [Pseudonocardiaceae bacterium]|nr:DAK2 domain-containing protein [Pseudonocardiaceae bacterium]